MNSNTLNSERSRQNDYPIIENHPASKSNYHEKLAIKHIREKMTDTPFQIIHLCKLKNTSLYRKILNYTGKTFIELIRKNQIAKAEELFHGH